MKKLAICLLSCIIFASCSAPPAAQPDAQSPPSSSSAPSSEAASAPSEAPVADLPSVDMELTSGHYTAGIDFPGGKYDIIAISGSGNVSSSNMLAGGLNAMMGVDDKSGTGLFEKEYQNIKLPKDTVLSVSGGVTVQILCEKPESATVPREQPNTETASLGNGNFVAGEDFAAGVYDVIATEGSGNVSSDNMFDGGINAMLGATDTGGMGLFEKEYKNVSFTEGCTLTISGVKVDLVPSK